MTNVTSSLSDVLREPDNLAKIQAAASELRTINGAGNKRRDELTAFFHGFRARIANVGFSRDHATSSLQIGLFNLSLETNPRNHGSVLGGCSEQVAAVIGFLSNDISYSVEKFDIFKCPPIIIEYYFRLLTLLPNKSEALEKMINIREQLTLESDNLGVFLLPATLAATLSRYELANELLKKPYADLIRPNMNNYYQRGTKLSESTDRYSYADDDRRRRVFINYNYEVINFRSPHQNDSMMVNYLCKSGIDKYIAAPSATPKTVFNFGSTYCWLEFNLA